MLCFMSHAQLRFVNINSPHQCPPIVVPIMRPRNPTLCCARIAEANQGPFVGHPSLDKSAQSVILCAARQNSRNSQWTTSVVPEPFFFFPKKVEQVLHKAISRASAFLVDGVHRPAHIRPSIGVFVAPQERFHHGPSSNRLPSFFTTMRDICFLYDCTSSVPVSSQLILQHRRSLASRAASPNRRSRHMASISSSPCLCHVSLERLTSHLQRILQTVTHKSSHQFITLLPSASNPELPVVIVCP